MRNGATVSSPARTIPCRNGRVSRGMSAAGTGPEASRLRRVLDDHPEFITDRVASRMCHVGLGMIYRWIDMRLWPLPSAVCREVYLFRRADVESWLGTGTWSGPVFFRGRRASR
jgi:hypothetical protein